MIRAPKIATMVRLINHNTDLWREKISHAYELGQRAGSGFALGNEYDDAYTALHNSGYTPICASGNFVVGTDFINGIVAVSDTYGPWAIDITEHLFNSIYSAPLGEFLPRWLIAASN